MRSIRKISLLVAVAAAAIAVAAPTASAAQMQNPEGELTELGSLFTMSSTNFVWSTSWGKLSCAEVTMPGELIQNDGETVKAEGGLGSAKNCFMGGTKAFTFEPELRDLTLNQPQAGTIDLKLKADYGNNVKCVYEGVAPVTYTAGGSSLKLTNAKLKPIPAACGPFLLNGDLHLEDWLGRIPVLY